MRSQECSVPRDLRCALGGFTEKPGDPSGVSVRLRGSQGASGCPKSVLVDLRGFQRISEPECLRVFSEEFSGYQWVTAVSKSPKGFQECSLGS